jgi:ankyrin repeat protein
MHVRLSGYMHAPVPSSAQSWPKLAVAVRIRAGLVLLTLVGISPEMLTVAQAPPPMRAHANARDSEAALIGAINQGDTAAVVALIKAGIDVNAKDSLGRTPLTWAGQWGRAEIIDVLVRAGADPNVKDQLGWTPITLAFDDYHFDAVQALIKAGADRSQVPKDLNAKDRAGFTPLAEALRRNDMSSVGALFQLGLDPNSRQESGRTILESAASGGNVELVRTLIEKGADVNASEKAEDRQGWTPLLLAAQAGHDDVVEALIKAGADANRAGPGGWNALMQASYFGHLDIARILIPVTDVHYRAKSGITALMLARWACRPEVVEALLKAGSVRDPHEWSRAPQFEDFPLARIYKGAPARVDLSSNPITREYRTRIREGTRKGTNFAGHFTVVSWGCGSNCETIAIVDALTGRVYDGIGDERGADYKINSSLIIADPGRPADVNGDDPTTKLPVRYYVWQENHFTLIYEQSCSDTKRECGCPELHEH